MKEYKYKIHHPKILYSTVYTYICNRHTSTVVSIVRNRCNGMHIPEPYEYSMLTVNTSDSSITYINIVQYS